MEISEEICSNFSHINENIIQAAKRAERDPVGIRVVAVSKKQPIEKMQAFINYVGGKGEIPLVGENYVQEFKKKREFLDGTYQAHLIGALQRNKAKDAVMFFDMIEGVHSVDVATAVNAAATKAHKVQDVLLQVNISNDPSKSGFSSDGVEKVLSSELDQYPSLRVRGLMTITSFYGEAKRVRGDYRALFQLKERVYAKGRDERLPPADEFELSMGMSSDYEIAVEEGATLVRVGTALFGERP